MKIEIHPSCLMIILAALIAGGLALFPVLQSWLGVVPGSVVSENIERTQLIAQVATQTIIPGPAGGNQIRTLVPTPLLVNSLADVQALRPALQEKTAFSSFHLDAVASITQSDTAWHCRSLKVANPLNINQELFPLPWTMYGSAILVSVDLVGGVLSADLREENNIHLQEIDMPPREQLDSLGRVVKREYLNGVEIRLKARFRVVSAGIRPGNQVKATISDVGSVWKTWIEVEKSIAEKLFPDYPPELRNVLVKQRDEVDTLVLEKATYQAFAPVNPDGSRDVRFLDMLRQKTFQALNTPGQAAYENLLKDVTQRARAAGIQGVVKLRVDLIPEETFRYYDGTAVIPGSLEKKFAYSECPDYSLPTDSAALMRKMLENSTR